MTNRQKLMRKLVDAAVRRGLVVAGPERDKLLAVGVEDFGAMCERIYP